jgi:Fe2+ transport system protein FeoA
MGNERPACAAANDACAGAPFCPLSRVRLGDVVCIKQLCTSPEMTDRLRELGLREEQKIKVLSRQANFICQVCNARLGLSQRLADNILVEPIPGLVPAD